MAQVVRNFFVYLAKHQPTVHGLLQLNTFDLLQPKVSPNPVSDKLNIVHTEPIDKIEIYTMVGQHIATQAFNAAAVQYDFSGFRNGLYLLRIQSGKATREVKIIKQ